MYIRVFSESRKLLYKELTLNRELYYSVHCCTLVTPSQQKEGVRVLNLVCHEETHSLH